MRKIEGNRPGVMQRLGVGYEDLKKENEKLIFCSISGYGQTGPYSQRAGHDSNYLAVSGLLGLSGKEGEIPPTIGFQSADAASSMQAVIGILAAILERQVGRTYCYFFRACVYACHWHILFVFISGWLLCGRSIMVELAKWWIFLSRKR